MLVYILPTLSLVHMGANMFSMLTEKDVAAIDEHQSVVQGCTHTIAKQQCWHTDVGGMRTTINGTTIAVVSDRGGQWLSQRTNRRVV